MHYPSQTVRSNILNSVDAKIIRKIALKEYKYAANAIWSHATLREEILVKMRKEIGVECQQLCSTKNPSILQKCNPDDLVAFSDEKCEEELKLRTPILYSCLHEAITNKRQQRRKNIVSTAPAIVTAAAILLKQRCPMMSAKAYRFSIGVLWHSGAKKQVTMMHTKLNLHQHSLDEDFRNQKM